MIKILFAAGDQRWAQFQTPLIKSFKEAHLDVDLALSHDPALVDYIIYAPNNDFADFRAYKNTKLVQSLWAGVEGIVTNQTLTQPLARMVDTGLTEGMVEWVTGHVLRHHLGMDRHIVNPNHEWVFEPAPLARHRSVGILGLGELGSACAKALAELNFQTSGWSRSPKSVEGVHCFSGADGLQEILKKSEILVLLLPLTKDTENTLDRETLSVLPNGAVIINPGRGALIDDNALLQSLDDGHISHATLDVFRTEPLPASDPYWAHPNVTVTPHLASETRADTASQIVADNIARVEAGKPARFLVNKSAGY